MLNEYVFIRSCGPWEGHIFLPFCSASVVSVNLASMTVLI